MPEQKSKLQQMEQAAFDHAEDVIVRTLMKQGVDEYVARKYLDQHVALRIVPGAGVRVRAEVEKENHRSRGWSDAYLVAFAQELHQRNPELGGKPMPSDFEETREDEGELDARARRAERIRVEEEARQARLAREAAWRAEAEKRRAEGRVAEYNDHRSRVQRSF